jgi:hypothetical protein
VYEVAVEERVVPLYERPAPIKSVETAPVLFPLRMPVRVEEPVPPTFTESVEVAPRVLLLVKYGIWFAAPV